MNTAYLPRCHATAQQLLLEYQDQDLPEFRLPQLGELYMDRPIYVIVLSARSLPL